MVRVVGVEPTLEGFSYYLQLSLPHLLNNCKRVCSLDYAFTMLTNYMINLGIPRLVSTPSIGNYI